MAGWTSFEAPCIDCCFGWLYKCPKNRPVCFGSFSFLGFFSGSFTTGTVDCEGRVRFGSGLDLSSFGACFEPCCFCPSFDGPDCDFGAGSAALACALRAAFSAFACFLSSAGDSLGGALVLSPFVAAGVLSAGLLSVGAVGSCGAGAGNCPASAAGGSDMFCEYRRPLCEYGLGTV